MPFRGIRWAFRGFGYWYRCLKTGRTAKRRLGDSGGHSGGLGVGIGVTILILDLQAFCTDIYSFFSLHYLGSCLLRIVWHFCPLCRYNQSKGYEPLQHARMAAAKVDAKAALDAAKMAEMTELANAASSACQTAMAKCGGAQAQRLVEQNARLQVLAGKPAGVNKTKSIPTRFLSSDGGNVNRRTLTVSCPTRLHNKLHNKLLCKQLSPCPTPSPEHHIRHVVTP